MKRVFGLPVVLSLVLAACEVTVHDASIVQPTQPGIQNVVFTVDTTYMLSSPGTLVAQGLATNSGTGAISAPWYVECTFYTDTTLSIVLGSNDYQVGVPLSPGESVYWRIEFSSSNVDVRRFPNFTVSTFRAYYKD